MRMVLLLTLLTLVIYANVFNAPFHFDDLSFILENPHVRSFRDLFTLDMGTDTRKFLTFFTFAVNFRISPYSPLLYRLVNIFFHVMTAFIFAGALRYLFQAPFFRKNNMLNFDHLAWGAAFIFCVHPLQTDSVTYIWQRSEVLSGFFYALVLMCYWRGRVENNWRFIVYAAAFFFTGLYAKGSVMSAPLLIGFSEAMFFGTGKLSIKNIRAFVLTVFSLILCAIVLDKTLFQVSFTADWRYFYTQCLVLWKYLQLTIFPIGQSVDHGFVWAETLWSPMVFLGFSGLLIIFAMILCLASQYRIACFGAAWFFIYLLPTSSVIPLLTPIFEHRLYFSLAGFGLMTSVIIWRLSGRNFKNYWIALSVIILAFSTTTIFRNQVWQTRTGLMEDAIRKSPNYMRPYFTLGSYYIFEKRFLEAEKMFSKCIELNPHLADAYNNLGVLLAQRGERQEAIELYQKSVENNPKFIDAYLNLSRYYYSVGRMDIAWQWISKILKINPDHRVYAYAAFLHIKAGNFNVAQQLLQKGFLKNHFSAKLLYSKGLWHFHQNYLEEAVVSFKSAAYYAPKWVSPFNELGVVYFMLKEYGLARNALERAHHLSPQDASIYLNLANVYHELGEFEKAEQYYQTSQYNELLWYIPANFDGRDGFLLN